MDPLQEQEENVAVSEEVMNIEGSACIREEDGEGKILGGANMLDVDMAPCAEHEAEERGENSPPREQTQAEVEKNTEKSWHGGQTRSEDEEMKENPLLRDLTGSEGGNGNEKSLFEGHTSPEDERKEKPVLRDPIGSEVFEWEEVSLLEGQNGSKDGESKEKPLFGDATVYKVKESQGPSGEDEEREENVLVGDQTGTKNGESKENSLRGEQTGSEDEESKRSSSLVQHADQMSRSEHEQKSEESQHGEQTDYYSEQTKEESQHGQISTGNEQRNEESRRGEQNGYTHEQMKETDLLLEQPTLRSGCDIRKNKEESLGIEDREHSVSQNEQRKDESELAEKQTTGSAYVQKYEESSGKETYAGIEGEKKLLLLNQGENKSGGIMSASKQGVLETKKAKNSENESLSLSQKSKRKRVAEESLVIGNKKQKTADAIEIQDHGKDNSIGLTVGQEKGKQKLSGASKGKKLGISFVEHSISLSVKEKMSSNFTSDAERKLDGIRYRLGDMVWAKVKSHPWWPGQLYDPDLASSSVIDFKRDSCFLVAFFGDSTFGWFSESELIPFEPNFPQKSKQTSDETFVDAVEDALDELYRRVKSGLTCSCKKKANIHAKIQHGKPRLLYDRQLQEARNAFEPPKLMAFIKQISCSPFSSSQKMLLTTIGGAQAHAFRIFGFSNQTPEYKDAFRDFSDEAVDDFKMDDNTQGKVSMRIGYGMNKSDSKKGMHTIAFMKGKKGPGKHLKIKQQDTSSIVYGTGKIKKRNTEKKKARHEDAIIAKKSNTKLGYTTPHPKSKPSRVSHDVISVNFRGDLENKDSQHPLVSIIECNTITENKIHDVSSEVNTVESIETTEKYQEVARKLASLKRRRMGVEDDSVECLNSRKNANDEFAEISTIHPPEKRRKTKSLMGALQGEDLTGFLRETDGKLSKRKSSTGNLEKDEKLKSCYKKQSLNSKAFMGTLQGENLGGSLKKENGKHEKGQSSTGGQEKIEKVRSLTSYITSYKEECSNPSRKQNGDASLAVDPDFQTLTQAEAKQIDPEDNGVIPMLDENKILSIEDSTGARLHDGKTKETVNEKDVMYISTDEPCEPGNLAVATLSGAHAEPVIDHNLAPEDGKAYEGNVGTCPQSSNHMVESISVTPQHNIVNQNFCNLKNHVLQHAKKTQEGNKKAKFERDLASSDKVITSKNIEVNEDVLKDPKLKNRLVGTPDGIDDKLQMRNLVQKSKKPRKLVKNRKLETGGHQNIGNSKPKSQGFVQKNGETIKVVKTRRFENRVDIDNTKSQSYQDFAQRSDEILITPKPLDDILEGDTSEYCADPAVSQKNSVKSLEEKTPLLSTGLINEENDKYTEHSEGRTEKIGIQQRESVEYSSADSQKHSNKPISSKKASPSVVSLRPAIDAEAPLHGSKGILNRFGQRIHTPKQASEQGRTLNHSFHKPKNVARVKDVLQERVIMIKFPNGSSLPSEQKLKETLLTFGGLKPKTIRMDITNSSAQVVYGNAESADEAMRILKSSSIYKGAHFSLKTKDIAVGGLQLDKKESKSLVSVQIPEMLPLNKQNTNISNAGVSLDNNYETFDKYIVNKPQKSCLRKANDPLLSGKSGARVTFQLKGVKMIGDSRGNFAISESMLKSGVENSGCNMKDHKSSDSNDISDRFITLLHQVHDLVRTSGFVL